MVLYWFNPLVWTAAIISKRDCELACDYKVLKQLGKEESLAYGRTLVDLIGRDIKKSDIFQMATTMYGKNRGIKERVTMIAINNKMKISVLVAVLVIIIMAVGCTFTSAPSNIDNNPIDKTAHMEGIGAYLEKASRETFSPYYELLDFIITDYQEDVVDGNIEAIFHIR